MWVGLAAVQWAGLVVAVDSRVVVVGEVGSRLAGGTEWGQRGGV